MDSASDGDPHRASDDTENAVKTDGSGDVTFDEAALYGVVRKAVEDAILGVIGTLLLVGTAFVVVWVGIMLVVQSDSFLLVGPGIAAIAWGLYLAAATLEIIPPVREWL